MSSLSAHLQTLKTFEAPASSGNKLYFLEVEEKPGMVKVGDTFRDVEVRNQETMTNASLHRKKGTKPVFVFATKWDGGEFRDKEFHAFLRKKGYLFEKNDQGNYSEWVVGVVVEQLLAELAEFIRKPVYRAAELRRAQHYLLKQLSNAKCAGFQFVNLSACVRVGKTIISLTHAATNGWFPVFIGKNLTSQASAESDNAEFGIVPKLLTQSLHGVDELVPGDLSKKAKQIIKQITEANVTNQPVIFYIDEVDDASHTKKSRDIIVPVVQHFLNSDLLGQVVTMSGTRIYRGEKILRAITSKPFKEISLEYYEMQVLQPETTCKRNFRRVSFYSESKDGLVNISGAMKTKEGRKSLTTVIVELLGSNGYNFEVNSEFPHWFIKFATVGKDNADELVQFLNRNYPVIENQAYYYQSVNGNVTSGNTAQEFCKDVIDKHPGQTCVFITQGMATTSFSIEGIGNSCVFTDNELTADDVQALHRSATWAVGKHDCNMVVITTNNSMEHSFDDIFEDETKNARDRGEKVEIYKELLLNNSMVHYVNGTSLRRVEITECNVADMLDKKMQTMTKVASIVGVLRELDDELVAAISSALDTRKNSTRRSKAPQGAEFDPFGKGTDHKRAKPQKSGELSLTEKERILRAFAESAVHVPAVAKEQGTSISAFSFWQHVGVSRDLFFEVYNSSAAFKDRIDAIYNLCNDSEYLVENYIRHLTT